MTIEIPESIDAKVHLETGSRNVQVLLRDELLAEEFDALVQSMKKHGFKLYSLFGYEDGLEITFEVMKNEDV